MKLCQRNGFEELKKYPTKEWLPEVFKGIYYLKVMFFKIKFLLIEYEFSCWVQWLSVSQLKFVIHYIFPGLMVMIIIAPL